MASALFTVISPANVLLTTQAGPAECKVIRPALRFCCRLHRTELWLLAEHLGTGLGTLRAHLSAFLAAGLRTLFTHFHTIEASLLTESTGRLPVGILCLNHPGANSAHRRADLAAGRTFRTIFLAAFNTVCTHGSTFAAVLGTTVFSIKNFGRTHRNTSRTQCSHSSHRTQHRIQSHTTIHDQSSRKGSKKHLGKQFVRNRDVFLFPEKLQRDAGCQNMPAQSCKHGTHGTIFLEKSICAQHSAECRHNSIQYPRNVIGHRNSGTLA
ncbi:hypothetical protein A6X21_05815 [Planctopirus hydrillae]|uniref:Uncharacterized protein n=1 Tax=Planctopirus hydrillae TaxID=1841610 RepID=A0A1C3EBH5_9PLAN|nr:hypothetical protein A6X21_05815 [Planctopirus hydrillae]